MKDAIKRILRKYYPVLLTTVIYWIITGFIPYKILYWEFPESYADVISYKYHNLFVFPLIMGWLLPLLVYPAMLFAWKKMGWEEKIILFAALAFVVIGGTLKNDSDDYTVWEIKPDSLSSSFVSKAMLLDTLQDHAIHPDSINQSIDSQSLIDHFKEPDQTFGLINYKEDSTKYNKVAQAIGTSFDNKIRGIQKKWSNRSYTRYTYTISVLIHLVAFISVYLISGFLFRRIVFETSEEEKKEYLNSTLRIALGLIVIIIWVYSRMGNQFFKQEIYGEVYDLFQESINLGIIALLFLMAIFIVGTLWLQIRATLMAIITLLSSLGLGTLSYGAFTNPETINNVMQQRDILTIGTFVVVLIGAIFTLPKPKKKVQAQNIDE